MTDLSPAAQAVLDAFGKHPLHSDHISDGLLYGALPAALRAAADHVEWPADVSLRIIASELEATT